MYILWFDMKNPIASSIAFITETTRDTAASLTLLMSGKVIKKTSTSAKRSSRFLSSRLEETVSRTPDAIVKALIESVSIISLSITIIPAIVNSYIEKQLHRTQNR